MPSRMRMYSELAASICVNSIVTKGANQMHHTASLLDRLLQMRKPHRHLEHLRTKRGDVLRSRSKFSDAELSRRPKHIYSLQSISVLVVALSSAREILVTRTRRHAHKHTHAHNTTQTQASWEANHKYLEMFLPTHWKDHAWKIRLQKAWCFGPENQTAMSRQTTAGVGSARQLGSCTLCTLRISRITEE